MWNHGKKPPHHRMIGGHFTRFSGRDNDPQRRGTRPDDAPTVARPLLGCTDGLVSYIRAIRETFREPVHTGQGGRPRLRPWRNILIAQVIKRYERRRVVETERRIVDGTPARVETLRRRAQGDGVINTAYIERLNATFRA